DVRLDVVEVEIEADVPVELAVASVAGVAFLRRPNGFRGLGVPREAVHARGGFHGSVAALRRGRGPLQNPVGVGEEIAEPGVLEMAIEAGIVSAFAQPDALRPHAEMPLVITHGDFELRL